MLQLSFLLILTFGSYKVGSSRLLIDAAGSASHYQQRNGATCLGDPWTESLDDNNNTVRPALIGRRSKEGKAVMKATKFNFNRRRNRLKFAFAAVGAAAVLLSSVSTASAISCFDGQTKTTVNGSTTDTYTCACNGWYLSARITTGTLCDSSGMIKYNYSRDVYAYYHSPRDCQVRANTLAQNSYSEVKATNLRMCYSPIPNQPPPPAPDACVVTSDNYYRTVEYRPPSRFAVVTGDWHWWTTAESVLCSNGSQIGLTTKEWGRGPWE